MPAPDTVLTNAKRGDVLHQSDGDTLWWLGDECTDSRLLDMYGDRPHDYVFTGTCIYTPDPDHTGWSVGDHSPFGTHEDDDELTLIGHCETLEQAIAIAALAGRDGFVKGDNND